MLPIRASGINDRELERREKSGIVRFSIVLLSPFFQLDALVYLTIDINIDFVSAIK